MRSYTHTFAFICLLIICISINHVESFSTYRYDPNNDEFSDVLRADTTFHARLNDLAIGTDEMEPLQSYGHIRFIPYKKRTIPIELQKALYAHGIVGRRRRRR